MPYISNANRKPIDPEIGTFIKTLLIPTGIITRKNGKYFFFRFLTVFYEELRETIAGKTLAKETRYKHYNALEGAFGCAGKELLDRWSGLITLKPRLTDWERMEEYAARYVTSKDVELLRMLSRLIVERFMIAFCEEEDELSSHLDTTVGEANYTISEIANAFVNERRASHQELLDMAIAAPWRCYERYARPYEDRVIVKNGDTAGFIRFHELFRPQDT